MKPINRKIVVLITAFTFKNRDFFTETRCLTAYQANEGANKKERSRSMPTVVSEQVTVGIAAKSNC